MMAPWSNGLWSMILLDALSQLVMKGHTIYVRVPDNRLQWSIGLDKMAVDIEYRGQFTLKPGQPCLCAFVQPVRV